MELVPLVAPIQPTDSRAVDIELDSMAAKVQVSSTEDHTLYKQAISERLSSLNDSIRH